MQTLFVTSQVIDNCDVTPSCTATDLTPRVDCRSVARPEQKKIVPMRRLRERWSSGGMHRYGAMTMGLARVAPNMIK